MKQVAAIYPDLDFSQVAINNTVPPTPGGADNISEEANFTHTVEEKVKVPDAEVIVQPALEGPVALVVLFTLDGSSIVNSSAAPS